MQQFAHRLAPLRYPGRDESVPLPSIVFSAVCAQGTVSPFIPIVRSHIQESCAVGIQFSPLAKHWHAEHMEQNQVMLPDRLVCPQDHEQRTRDWLMTIIWQNRCADHHASMAINLWSLILDTTWSSFRHTEALWRWKAQLWLWRHSEEGGKHRDGSCLKIAIDHQHRWCCPHKGMPRAEKIQR